MIFGWTDAKAPRGGTVPPGSVTSFLGANSGNGLKTNHCSWSNCFKNDAAESMGDGIIHEC